MEYPMPTTAFILPEKTTQQDQQPGCHDFDNNWTTWLTFVIIVVFILAILIYKYNEEPSTTQSYTNQGTQHGRDPKPQQKFNFIARITEKMPKNHDSYSNHCPEGNQFGYNKELFHKDSAMKDFEPMIIKRPNIIFEHKPVEQVKPTSSPTPPSILNNVNWLYVLVVAIIIFAFVVTWKYGIQPTMSEESQETQHNIGDPYIQPRQPRQSQMPRFKSNTIATVPMNHHSYIHDCPKGNQLGYDQQVFHMNVGFNMDMNK